MISLAVIITAVVLLEQQQAWAQQTDKFDPLQPVGTCTRVSTPVCNVNKRYSEIDGSCNNLKVPWTGRSNTPYKRYLPNSYDDGWNAPRRRSVNGAPLLNPRIISRLISLDKGQLETIYDHLFTIFGQFVAHDLTLANTATG